MEDSILNLNNLKNIKVSDKLKYSNLVQLLGLQNNKGKQKIIQLDKLKCYFDYEYINKYYVIKDIYTTEQIQNNLKVRKENKTTRNNSKYIEHTEKILINLLLNSLNYRIESIKASEILREFNLVNSQYYDVFSKNINKKLIINDLNNYLKNKVINKFNIMYFYSIVYDKNRMILNNTLNSLQNKNIIKYEKLINIVRLAKLNDNVSNICDNSLMGKSSTNEIIELENYTLEKLNLQNKRDIFIQNKQNLFYTQVKLNFEKKYNYTYAYYYNYFKIELIENSTPIEPEILYEFKRILNLKFIKSLNSSIDRYIDKYGEDDTVFGKSDKKQISREVQNKLIDMYIRI